MNYWDHFLSNLKPALFFVFGFIAPIVGIVLCFIATILGFTAHHPSVLLVTVPLGLVCLALAITTAERS